MPKAIPKPSTKTRKKAPKPEKEVSELGRILTALAQANVASGAKLLSRREVRREVYLRRNGE